MDPLLSLSRAIDALTERLGRVASWAVLVAVLVSAGNALWRYLLGDSSNAWLELQWYLFAAIVMLGAARVLRVNEHVRVDVIYGRLSPRARVYVDLFGLCVFLVPGAVLVAWTAWPWLAESFVSGEVSANAGGLLRWPAKALVPLGYALLLLQSLAEIVRRVAWLRGHPDALAALDIHYEKPLQ